jgi:hypothetical protein
MSSFKFDNSGFDKLAKELNSYADKIKNLNGTTVNFDVLFSSRFMESHTNVSSFEEFLEKGNFIVETEEDFEAIPDDVFDAYVQSSTDFSSWEEMFDAATDDYLDDQLNL